MTIQQIVQVAKVHGIQTRERRGRVELAEIYSTGRRGRYATGRKWIDATEWSSAKLNAWLGY